MDQHQFTEIFVRGDDDSAVTGRHPQHVNIGHTQRDGFCIEAIMPEFANHRDYFHADVRVGEKLHVALRSSSSCRTTETAYANAAITWSWVSEG